MTSILNRRVLLVRRPSGIPQLDDFRLDDAAVAPLAAGQFLVRNRFLSVDPAQRGWASGGANYAEPVPLGGVMRALAVGEIVESLSPAYPVGTHVYGWFGWQHYAVAGPNDVLTRFEPEVPLSAYAGVLGINGMTAHLALHGIGRPRRGETVLVSTAAGAVGSLVGQLAREAGCRVVGLTGGAEKAALCVERFGYDVALDYRDSSVAVQLGAALPEGVDVYFDNIGGDILDTALRAMRTGGRIVQCGTASIASWSPPPVGLRNEREILTRRLTWGGFVIFDHVAQFADSMAFLLDKLRAGHLTYDEDIRHGIEGAPQALLDVYAGRNRGKMLLEIS